MLFYFLLGLSLVAFGMSAPMTYEVHNLASSTPVNSSTQGLLRKRFDCSTLVSGLNHADCEHMSNIGMAGQGINSFSNNGKIWIGSDGPNTFTFINRAGDPAAVDVTLIIWYQASDPIDYSSSFLNVHQPYISYSLSDLQEITISIANGISGGWAGLYNDITFLSNEQIYNTWGEFTTGEYGTVDVSREVNMGGNGMSINLDSGCISNMDTCVFQCNNGDNVCGDSGTYSMINTDAPNCYVSYNADGNPGGGCQGFSYGGHMDVTFFDH